MDKNSQNSWRLQNSQISKILQNSQWSQKFTKFAKFPTIPNSRNSPNSLNIKQENETIILWFSYTVLASSYHKDSLESRDRILKSRSTSVLKISLRDVVSRAHRKHLLMSGTRDIIRPISMEHNHLLHFWVQFRSLRMWCKRFP